MVTLGEARERVRRRLEDAAATALWPDALLDDGLSAELDAYSQWLPAQRSATVIAAAGDTTLALPAEAVEVRRVLDPNGAVVPPSPAGVGLLAEGDGRAEQGWERWDAALRLRRPLAAGTYTLLYTAVRVMPSGDAEPFPVRDADVSLIVAGAAAYALETRAIQEWKRGALPDRYETALRVLKAAYDAAWDQRRRRVRVWAVD